MSSRWLKWTASVTRVMEKTPESEVPKLPKPTPESSSGTSGTLALGGERTYYAHESPWSGYNGGRAFVCKSCGCASTPAPVTPAIRFTTVFDWGDFECNGDFSPTSSLPELFV